MIRGVLFGAGLLATGVVAAHECWLAPRRYEVLIGTRQHIARCVGEGFRAEPWEITSRKVRRVLHLAPGHQADLTASVTAGDTLRTTLAFTRPGTNMLVLRSAENLITLDGPKFNAYLREDGLETVLAQRTANGELTKPGREAYSRCLKTLIRVNANPGARSLSTAADTSWHQVLGLPLELQPEQDPYQLRAGDSLTVRLLAGGQPAAGQLIQIWSRTPARAGTVAPLRLRSDLRGRVRFRLPRATAMMVSCVRMTPHPSRDSADWQSTWASLTFGGPAH
ncbi:MAG: DUF4198 domain-containing protein [Hymenobacteraceae bacterium]|nr:DUF4198 domain-containing protein [Hymenobacteraceae bacterium]